MDNRNLPYRKGWPQLPPLPVDTITKGACDTGKNWYAVIETVDAILKAQDILNSHICFAFRVPKVQQPDETYRTLVIRTGLSHNPIGSSLILRIRKYLQQDATRRDLFIEIIDERIIDGLFSFAIPPSMQDLVGNWEKIFNAVLDEIGQQKERWITMKCCVAAGIRTQHNVRQQL